MMTLGMTYSVCPVCRALVPAKLVTQDDAVYFEKFCADHGPSRSLIRRNIAEYLRSLSFVKPASVPRKFAGDSGGQCPQSCGFCDRHEQHLCMPIIEITSRCDLECPICLVDAGAPWDMTLEQFRNILDNLLAAEGQIDVLNLSGGEPLLHPHLPEILDEALSRPDIVRVSISTNGLALLRKPELLRQLYDRHVVVSLQFDGFDPAAWRRLRGQDLSEKKQQILDRLAAEGISTSLTLTAAAGINDHQLGRVADYFFDHPHIVSLMIQPLARAGRASNWPDETVLSIPDVIQKLSQQTSRINADDFAPLPCSHPLCFSLAYYLTLDKGRHVALNRLVDADTLMDTLANRTVFGLDAAEQDRLRDLVYQLWSGPSACAPDSQSVFDTLREILNDLTCCSGNTRQVFTLAERRIKSIFIHSFQDANTFDLARLRRCCQAYPQPDGKLIPACAHNVLKRNTMILEKNHAPA